MARDFNTPPLPLELLTLHPRHHRAALWWLGWLYRNPDSFRSSLEKLPRWPAIRAALAINLHVLPWALVIGIGLKIWLFHAGLANASWGNRPELERWIAASWQVIVGQVIGLGVGIVVVVVVGVVVGLGRGLGLGLVFGLIIGLDGGLVFGLDVGLGLGLAFGLCGGFVGGLSGGNASGLVVGIASGLVGGLLGGLGVGIASGLVVGVGGALGIWISSFRVYYFPIHAAFWFLRHHPACFRYHPAAWDWMCLLPFPRLDRLLVAYSEQSPSRMEGEIDRLIEEVPGLRVQALCAFTILRARHAARLDSLRPLSAALADLPEGTKGFLADNRRVRELAEEIVGAQLRVDETSRAYFREMELRSLVTLIESFRMKVSGMHEPVATEFRRAAEAWRRLAEAQYHEAVKAAKAEPAPQVFRAGDPVKSSAEAFVPRFRVLEELEGQVMLGSGCPGILLRGPRRMGKSSLLRNVSGFLPMEVGVAFVSLQSAKLFTSLGHLVGGLSEAIVEVLSSSPGFVEARKRLEGSRPADLPELARFLDECNGALESTGRRVILALDEYEMLDEKLREGVFTKDLLATIRESIQSHRRIIWAFSGNADITELTGADWTSYLISVRTLEVPVFSPEETHLLLTEPLKHSVLGEEDKANSALFWKEFWGEDGIALIHAESGGWPYFVQLIAETAVTLANESGQTVRSLPPPVLEQALDTSVERGRNAFHQLLRAQSRVAGEWEYLAAFARRETQAASDDADVRRSLERRRLLVAASDAECRLRVPLMSRWLRKEA